KWYRFDNVTLPNGDAEKDIPGDDVGVLSSWEPPSLEVPITPADRQWVRDLVTASSFLREDAHSKDWVGKPLGVHFGLDPDNKVDRFRIKKLLKRLLDEGTMRTIERIDGGRHKRKYMTTDTTCGSAPP